MFQPTSFNPLDYSSLSDSIGLALMSSELLPLSMVETFSGAGVYALFYHGDFPAYALITSKNHAAAGSWPIYVGKAAPSTRTGGMSVDPMAPAALFVGNSLYKRVQNHRDSIASATNLDVADFDVRLLVLSYIWVPMAETAMIFRYQPIWNTLVDGFGNHNPGRGRINGVRSRWDTLHPGRPWASRYPERKETAAEIAQDARQKIAESMR